MGKILEGLLLKKQPSKKNLQSLLQKRDGNDKKVSYVLITCTEPDSEGAMQVEMRYEGDKKLVAYLIQSAQAELDKEMHGSD